MESHDTFTSGRTAEILEISRARLRDFDDRLQPTRTAAGWRVYRRDAVEALAAERRRATAVEANQLRHRGWIDIEHLADEFDIEVDALAAEIAVRPIGGNVRLVSPANAGRARGRAEAFHLSLKRTP